MLENRALASTFESKRLEVTEDTEKCIMRSLTNYHYDYKINMKWARHVAPMGVVSSTY
jgi:hypothetical protein